MKKSSNVVRIVALAITIGSGVLGHGQVAFADAAYPPAPWSASRIELVAQHVDTTNAMRVPLDSTTGKPGTGLSSLTDSSLNPVTLPSLPEDAVDGDKGGGGTHDPGTIRAHPNTYDTLVGRSVIFNRGEGTTAISIQTSLTHHTDDDPTHPSQPLSAWSIVGKTLHGDKDGGGTHEPATGRG